MEMGLLTYTHLSIRIARMLAFLRNTTYFLWISVGDCVQNKAHENFLAIEEKSCLT